MSAEKIASQAYLEVAAAHGVEYVFGLPGTANSVGALYDAYRDRSPVIVTSTNVDTRIDGRDSHTEGKNLVEMTKQFTKWSAEVHRADRIPEYLNRAFKVAATPPTGPVYLALPSNLLGSAR